MQIHRIRGRSLQDALERAKSAYGDDAVVLSQELRHSGRSGALCSAPASRHSSGGRDSGALSVSVRTGDSSLQAR